MLRRYFYGPVHWGGSDVGLRKRAQEFVLFDPNIFFRSFRAQTPKLCWYFAPEMVRLAACWVLLAL